MKSPTGIWECLMRNSRVHSPDRSTWPSRPAIANEQVADMPRQRCESGAKATPTVKPRYTASSALRAGIFCPKTETPLLCLAGGARIPARPGCTRIRHTKPYSARYAAHGASRIRNRSKSLSRLLDASCERGLPSRVRVRFEHVQEQQSGLAAQDASCRWTQVLDMQALVHSGISKVHYVKCSKSLMLRQIEKDFVRYMDSRSGRRGPPQCPTQKREQVTGT